MSTSSVCGLTAEKLISLRRVGGLAVSPDGRRAAYTQRDYDETQDQVSTSIWCVELHSPSAPPSASTSAPSCLPRRLTTVLGVSDHSPVWAPNGDALAFLSRLDRHRTAAAVATASSAQVFVLPMWGGGEPYPLTRFAVDVETFRWCAPEASDVDSAGFLVFSARVLPEGQQAPSPPAAASSSGAEQCSAEKKSRFSHTAAFAEKRAKQKHTAYTELPMRNWDHWEDGLRSHLFGVNVHREHSPRNGTRYQLGGPTLELMPSRLNADCPVPVFCGVEEYAVSPDGKQLCYAAKVGGAERAWTTNVDLFLTQVPAEVRNGDATRLGQVLAGGAPSDCLTESRPGVNSSPLFSPSGAALCYLDMERACYEADQLRIHVYTLSSKESSLLTPASFVYSVSQLIGMRRGAPCRAVATMPSLCPASLVLRASHALISSQSGSSGFNGYRF
jgi:dipeptidyl aminopeptidase/acylaminoacyl peptidase